MKNLTFGLGALNLMGGRAMAVLIAALLVVALAAAGVRERWRIYG